MGGKSEWRARDTAVNIACQKESIVHYIELDVLLVLLVHFYYFLLKKNDEKDATNLPKVLEIPAADIRKAAFCGWGDFFCSFLIIYV